MGAPHTNSNDTHGLPRVSRPGDAEALLAVRWSKLGAYALQRAYGGEPTRFDRDRPDHPRLRQLALEIHHPFEDLRDAVRYQLGRLVPALAVERGGFPGRPDPAERLGRQLGLMEGVIDSLPWESQLRCLANEPAVGGTEALFEGGCRQPALEAMITGYHQAMDTRIPHRPVNPRAAARKRAGRAVRALRVEELVGRRATRLLSPDLR